MHFNWLTGHNISNNLSELWRDDFGEVARVFVCVSSKSWVGEKGGKGGMGKERQRLRDYLGFLWLGKSLWKVISSKIFEQEWVDCKEKTSVNPSLDRRERESFGLMRNILA